MKKIKYSMLVASMIFFTGCNFDKQEKFESTEKQIVLDKVKETKEIALKRSFNIQVGDTEKTIFERLGAIDGNIYILDSSNSFYSKISVNNIEDLKGLSEFFIANNYIVVTNQVEGTKYINVSVKQQTSELEKKLKDTNVVINGNVLVGDAINMITNQVGIAPIWDDKSSTNLSQVTKTYNFDGNGLDGLNHIINSVDLNLEFKDNKAIISYFKTETMSLDIFSRDRETDTDISIAMRNLGGDSSGGSSVGSSSGSSSEGGNDLVSKYKTMIIEDLKTSLSSVLSEHGSYTFLATSGQILIKDKASHVKMAQKVVSDFNSKFKDTVELTLTLYKVTREKNDTRGIDFKSLSKNFEFNVQNMVSTAFGSSANGNNFGIGFNDGNVDAVLQFLREYGDTEIVNPMTFETQTNLLKTIKIANNYGYIASISSTTDGNGGTTGSVTPSSIADGGFVSVLTKVIDNETIAVDLFTTTTSLSKFNSATAFGNTVQTPDTAEQSIDGYHRVKIGVPNILVSHKFEETQNKGSGLQADYLENIGLKADKNKDTYIVVVLEARVKK